MINKTLTKTILTTLFAICTFAVGLMAQQTPQLKTSKNQVSTVLTRITTKATALQNDITRNSAYSTASNADENVADQLTALANSANSLRSGLNQRDMDATVDVNDILDRATRINRRLTRTGTSSRITTQWTSLRSDINTLAGNYGVSWNWNQSYPSGSNNGGYPGNNGNNNGGYPGNNGSNNGSYPGNNGGYPGNNGNFNSSLTGTYRLNASMSDNVGTVLDRSMGSYDATQRDSMRRRLERRLESPEMIAIDKSGRSITLASSNQAQSTFDADGVARTETNEHGRTITTKVTATNNNLTIDYTGDRVNDFNVTFDVDRSGRLKVTRRIYLEGRNDTVTASSVYDRTSQTADFTNVRPSSDRNSGGYNSGNGGNNGSNSTGNSGSGFYIPNGVTLTATLRNAVSTKASQTGDRFTMDVQSPGQYRGAVIEGRVTQNADSGRVTGRANIQLDFDTLTMNGRTYQFAGVIQNVTAANGDSVIVNNEGTIKDSSQGNKTATRAGIGAVLGALVGAIAGGGSGAAIGAGVGAGAGAGTVLVGGRDSIELGNGSTFTILTSAPINSVRN